MLKIVFGDADNSIYQSPTYFDNTYEDEWITDPRSVKMIKDIDKSDVAGGMILYTKILITIHCLDQLHRSTNKKENVFI